MMEKQNREIQIEQIKELTPSLKDELLDVWEQSERSSHHFLSEKDVAYYRPRVRNVYLPAVQLYVIRAPHVVAFMGLSDELVEMLFVLPSEKGKGYGSMLLDFAQREKQIHRVDVNEQNEEAYRFYLNRGYQIIGRDELDPDGKPFPIVHLEKSDEILNMG